MKSEPDAAVAIVGGGFSGTILAAQLARRGIDNVLIDGSGRAGRGVAYSTTDAAHLLNVPADGMSAWAGEPGHFADYAASHGVHGRGFAQRRLFGRYLGEILTDAVASGHTRVVEQTATKAERAECGWRIELESGESLESHALALALGNQQPEPMSAFAGAVDRFIADPWAGAARHAVAELVTSGASALLIGTGLTMVDLVLSLDAAGYRGVIIALSRRGQIPRAHAEYEPAPVEAAEVPHGDLLDLWRWLRKRGAEVGWRAAVDSLRPHSRRLWQSFDGEKQKRFLRHARPWWDVHRHRIAPQVASTIAGLVAEGRLEVLSGRVLSARDTGDALEVEIRRRGAASPRMIEVAYAFNCTGPLHAIGRTRDSLLRSLLQSGSIRPDHLGIGLDVDASSRVCGADRLWALGPLTKGRQWEMIAVPDIREQAAEVAQDIERELGR